MNIKKNPSDKKSSASKKKYESPTISYTEIEPEEAIMGFCKTGGAGGIPTGCSLPCGNPGS